MASTISIPILLYFIIITLSLSKDVDLPCSYGESHFCKIAPSPPLSIMDCTTCALELVYKLRKLTTYKWS